MMKRIKMLLSTISPKGTTYLRYFCSFKHFPNLRNPKDINEKLQYLKLKTYYDNPLITQCVDKYRVRGYLEERKLDEMLPGLIEGGFTRPERVREIWERLPDAFVLKCNHGCGYNILVPDKKKACVDDVVKQLATWMREDYWKIYCEPQYKNVRKSILIEEYLGDNIQTYKFYCFNGEPRVLYVSANGENGEKDLYLDYYDMNWQHLDIALKGHLHAPEASDKPENFEEMIEVARELARDFPFVRVDLYDVAGKIFFSELTFIPTGGNMELQPKTVLTQWGEWLTLA